MKNVRKAKGFTLVELIIVIALFSIILTLVMSFIDPVSKVMKKASTKERTAAYVNNIGLFLEDSIHYSKYMYVLEGGYVGVTLNKNTGVSSLNGASSAYNTKNGERELVEMMVNDYFPFAVNYKGDPLTGKVHVLKLINTPDTSIESIKDCAEAGQIYETTYKFTAPHFVEKSAGVYDKVWAEATPVTENVPRINPEHLKDYSYYYKSGFYTLTGLENYKDYVALDGEGKEINDEEYFNTTADKSYTALTRLTYGDENTPVEIKAGENYALSVVSYMTKGGSHKETALHDELVLDDEGKYVTKKIQVPVFRSPANCDTVSMAMKNIDPKSFEKDSEVLYTGILLDKQADGDGEDAPLVIKGPKFAEGSSEMTYKTMINDGTKNFFRMPKISYDKKDGLTDNIYIFYILPSEINDSYVKLGDQVAPGKGDDDDEETVIIYK